MGSGSSNQINTAESSCSNITIEQGSHISQPKSRKDLNGKSKADVVSFEKPLQNNDVQNTFSFSNTSVIKEEPCQNCCKKFKELEQELARVESERLDLLDQIQLFEERSKEKNVQGSQSSDSYPALFNESLHVKDQCILKLEKDLQKAVDDSNKMQRKLKKQVRVLRKQIQEMRQETFINKMEVKAQQRELEEEESQFSEISTNRRELKTLSDFSMDENNHSKVQIDENNHSKVIVELSSQLNEQNDLITALELSIAKKDLKIQELQMALGKQSKTTDSHKSDTYKAIQSVTNGIFSHKESVSSQSSLEKKRLKNVEDKPFVCDKKTNKQNICPTYPSYERQPSVLSDSDSDWDVNTSPPNNLFSNETRVRSAEFTSNKVKEDTATKPASASPLDSRDNKRLHKVEQQLYGKPNTPLLAFDSSNDKMKSGINFDSSALLFVDSSKRL
ncbi:myosin heavy chain, striated muscle-like isoform X2 [Physella acuta]|uniref:myosin heavy chain, striated muscle-like isoform X2 n=1 Tax=Physella acuta TaxID=109671 RepID=UPI0027DB8B35|nr:myosin heavy chain, striated muscle-like isoform X2 [Physella acuta]